MKRICVAAVFVLCAGCSSAAHEHATDFGPLANAHWPTGSIRSGDVLSDDGTRLWALSVDGRRRVVWRHTRINGRIAAASPNGLELAYVAFVPRGAGENVFLYLLRRNGQVRSVERATQWIHGVAFLRPSGEARGPVRLYWIRDAYVGRHVGAQLRVLLDSGPHDVHLNLRREEAPTGLTGYPGSSIHTVQIGSRYGAVDTLLYGVAAGPPEPLHLWAPLEPPAWPTPFELVAHTVSGVQLYDVECGSSSRLVARRDAVDNGMLNEGDWPFVPMDADRVTVIPPLHARSERDAMTLSRHPQPVDLLNVRTGRLQQTRLRFFSRFGSAGWVAVQPPRSSDVRKRHEPLCARLNHEAKP